MFALLVLLVPLVATVTPVLSQACNVTSPCPSAYPCCSEYGFCGTGYYCLGGCDPLGSHALDSCNPNPLCETANYTLSDTSRILSNYTLFNGNASQYDWVVEEGSVMNTTSGGESAVALILTENGGGTLVSSTRYVHYGTITARLKTGQWAGVVTAFITMSSIKDEIDWEFPGNATTQGQTNYFWQGFIPQQTNGVIEYGFTDTYTDWHDYTIDWQPTALTFSVDGNVTRTIQASECVNNATGVSEYPNTPSRIQLSLWPAGIASEPQGTVEWAGGMINWNDSDYVSAGHFYALFQSVSVTCNDPNPPNANDTGYVYGANTTLDTPSITYSNKTIILPKSTTGGTGGASSLTAASDMHGALVACMVAMAMAAHLL